MEKTSQYFKVIGILGIFSIVWVISLIYMPKMAFATGNISITFPSSDAYASCDDNPVVPTDNWIVGGRGSYWTTHALYSHPSSYAPSDPDADWVIYRTTALGYPYQNIYMLQYSRCSAYWKLDDIGSINGQYSPYWSATPHNDLILNYIPPNLTTHFSDIQPVASSTQATSTTFAFSTEGYINPSDYVEGMKLKIYFTQPNDPVGLTALDAWESATQAFDDPFIFDISTSTDFSFSSTTDFSDSKYIGIMKMKAELWKPVVNSALWGLLEWDSMAQVISTSSIFTIVEKSTSDLAREDYEESIAAVIATSTRLTNCYITDFDFGKCMYSLFLPTKDQFQDSVSKLKEGVLVKFPLGYITSFIDILNSTTTTALPRLAVVIPDGFPAENTEIDLSPWGHMLGDGSILATATSSSETGGKTLMGLFMPYWSTLVYFMLGLYVLRRIMGSHIIGKTLNKFN